MRRFGGFPLGLFSGAIVAEYHLCVQHLRGYILIVPEADCLVLWVSRAMFQRVDGNSSL